MPVVNASGTSAGSGVLTGTAGVLQLLSGTAAGLGTFGIPPQTGSGTTAGAATVTGDASRIIGAAGAARGSGVLGWTGPLPMYGTSALTGNLVSEVAPLPISASSTTKALRWGETFQEDDLVLTLRAGGLPVMVQSVSYTLYQVVNGYPHRVGPPIRVPGTSGLGVFYAIGKIGEGGQPGDWVVLWRYQRFSFSGIIEVEFPFTVQDAVLAADPHDSTVRIEKYGWN